LITVAITARMDSAIECLEQGDLDGAELQARSLQMTVDRMPRVTAELLAEERLQQIREDAARGLRQVQEGAAAGALETFQYALKMWLRKPLRGHGL